MVSRRLLSLLAVAALLVPAGFAAAAEPAPAGPTRIGTVNVNKVLADLQEMKDLQVYIQSQVKSVQDEQTRRKQKLEEVKGQLVILAPGSKEYKAKSDEFLALGVNLEVYMRMQQAELTRYQKDKMSELFKKVEEASGKVAEAEKIDLVVVENPAQPTPADLEKMTPEQLAAWMGQKVILYRKGNMELTDKVARSLNDDYNKPKK